MIPVFEPQITAADMAAVQTALEAGEISGTFGKALERFEQGFARYIGCHHGVAVSSGTTALQLAVRALNIGAGDEVLVSASTNIATALAVFHNGAVTVPIDSESSTWNLDLDLLERHITPRTRALLPVHLFGHPVDMDRLMAIAEKHGLAVIEDCAEAHGAKVRGKTVGTFGQLSCFSFYANKLITTGEGGMVLTDDDALAERLRLLRNLAFQTPRFFHEHAGYNFRMTGLQAALGASQLERLDAVITDKRRVAALYQMHLAGIPGLRLPIEAEFAHHVYWMFGVVVERAFGRSRDELAAHLRGAGIETRTFFCPMNLQPFLQSQPGFISTACPVAEALWHDGLYLPSSCNLDEATIAHIAQQIRAGAQ